jgi:hypothetical protein
MTIGTAIVAMGPVDDGDAAAMERRSLRWGIEPSAGSGVWFEVDRPRSVAPLPIIGEAPPPS